MIKVVPKALNMVKFHSQHPLVLVQQNYLSYCEELRLEHGKSSWLITSQKCVLRFLNYFTVHPDQEMGIKLYEPTQASLVHGYLFQQVEYRSYLVHFHCTQKNYMYITALIEVPLIILKTSFKSLKVVLILRNLAKFGFCLLSASHL